MQQKWIHNTYLQSTIQNTLDTLPNTQLAIQNKNTQTMILQTQYKNTEHNKQNTVKKTQ